jgi:hypothetical protein
VEACTIWVTMLGSASRSSVGRIAPSSKALVRGSIAFVMAGLVPAIYALAK